jgi:hypothetical protein
MYSVCFIFLQKFLSKTILALTHIGRNELKIRTEMPVEFWFISVPNDEL